jgi:virginiamycin A acetyltransferase
MKSPVKFLANRLATILVLPAVLLHELSRRGLGSGRSFPGWSQALALLPGLSGQFLRRAFYQMVLSHCGEDACICFGTIFSHMTAEVGHRVYIGPYCCLGDVTLEDDLLLGSNVSIVNGGAQHGIERLDIPIREQPGGWPRITVGQNSWIGDRAIVMADVGKHCVIGAGAVVTASIPEFAIAVGTPARVIRFRDTPRHELAGV